MTDKAPIKEIFSSIQGEGPYIGYKQLFIRFCGCNLKCNYCDTDFDTSNSTLYSVDELANIVDNTDCHSVSLTGGEPLLHSDFLKKFLPKLNTKNYLETNATLPDKLQEIIDYVDIISADIKLKSCTGSENKFDIHNKFFEISNQKELFAKVVFDENITEGEIFEVCKLGKKYNIQIVLQPKMTNNTLSVTNEFIQQVLDKFLSEYKNIRLIPQVHKFLDVR